MQLTSNLKNLKNIHEGVLLLVKLKVEACNFTKSKTLPWVFLTFFKLDKWYHISQSIKYAIKHLSFSIGEQCNQSNKAICLFQ